MTRKRRPRPTFSIRVASRLTGLSPETLRMWERRYGFPSPARSASGQRAYSDADVERLRLVVKALAAGYRPREVVAAAPAQLRAFAQATAEVSPRETAAPLAADGGTVPDALAALRAHDVTGMEAMLHARSAALSPQRFVVEVAAPLVEAVGALWERGQIEVRHEHLFSEILVRHLHALRARCAVVAGAPRVLLATLPGELHALGMEMAALYLAALGAEARVLGTSTPPLEIARAVPALHADAVGLSVSSSADGAAVRAALDVLVPELPRRVPVWLGGHGAEALGVDLPGVRVLVTWADLEAALGRLRPPR